MHEGARKDVEQAFGALKKEGARKDYFHYWNEMKGFNKVVEDAWREGPCNKTNAMGGDMSPNGTEEEEH
ncbi:hypothetical protein Tco_1132473 [Tanacetum coccineum]|uniref:Uncharacterized protein n=1 Tax=Tanacetum coccineum TaxID=301880 RepID=A0ABQ5JC07_9ASTR